MNYTSFSFKYHYFYYTKILTIGKTTEVCNEQSFKRYFNGITSTAMWGLVGILVQYLISSEYFTPEWLVNTRLLASGIILLVITYIFYERNIFKVLKTDFISLLLLGVIGLLGSQYGFYICINHSNAPTATF